MKWLNEPASWQRTGDVLSVSVDPGTDFWRETGYGYIHDSGHVYGEVHEGDVDVSVCVRGAFGSQYDQAGIMLRLEERVWLKTGLEFFEGRPRLSTVLTLGRSSWIVTDLPEWMEEITLRASRRGDAVEVRYLVAGGSPELAALVYLPPGREVLAGIMCAAPEGPGFIVNFSELSIERGWSARLAKMAAERRAEEAAGQSEEAPGLGGAVGLDETVVLSGQAEDRGEATTEWRHYPVPSDAEPGYAEPTGFVPSDAEPGDAEPAGFVPADAEAAGFVPADFVPGFIPGDAEPGYAEPAGFVAADAEEARFVVGGFVVGHADPDDGLPGEAVSASGVPGDVVPDDGVPGDAVPDDPGRQDEGQEDVGQENAEDLAGEPAEPHAPGWAAAPTSDTGPHWAGEPARNGATDWALPPPADPEPRLPAAASETNASGWPSEAGSDEETRWFSSASDAAATRRFGEIPSEDGPDQVHDESAWVDAEGDEATPVAPEPLAAVTSESSDSDERWPWSGELRLDPLPAPPAQTQHDSGLPSLDEPAPDTPSPAESGPDRQQPEPAAEPAVESAAEPALDSPDLSRESSDDITLKWLAELREDSDPMWPKEPSRHDSGPLKPAAEADDSPPAPTAKPAPEEFGWPKSRAKGAASDWDRLVAGSRAGTWMPAATPDVGDRWPGPPLLDIAARERQIPDPRPAPPVEAPGSWAQPEGLSNHTTPARDGSPMAAEAGSRPHPPPIDLPPPPDPAEEWISLLTVDPAEE